MITLSNARDYHGYSINYVAEKCGVSSKTIKQMEKNSENILISLLQKLLILYKFPLSYIYIGDTEKKDI